MSAWVEVLNNLHSSIFQKEEDVMRVIELSYDHLPDHLKPCLLYLASYPKDRAVDVLDLKNLWCCEGLVQQTEMKSLEEVMDNLTSSSLVISFNEIGKERTCQIHDLVHNFCLIKAREEKLFDEISSSAPSSSSSDLMRRQITINYDTEDFGHFGHSGYKHLYSLRITGYLRLFDSHLRHLRLLRVLQLDITVNDSLLNEICTLVHLRYLKIKTKIESLPLSFSNLWNLETLLVISNKLLSLVLLPTILDLVKLRVLGIYYCSFFDLDTNEPILVAADSKLENLRLMWGLRLSYSKDTEDIFKWFPNLQKLEFDLEESWDCSSEGYWFPKVDFLNELEIITVTFQSSNSSDSAPFEFENRLWNFHFPSSLKKLSFCLFPLTSDSLSTIARLPNLEELNLISVIITGKEWNMGDEDNFENLKCLMLQQVTLAKWVVREESFPALEKLRLRYCPKLEEIPLSFGDICSLRSIELEWNPQLKKSAREIKQYVEDMTGEDRIQVLVYN